jgi:hypothetical protein
MGGSVPPKPQKQRRGVDGAPRRVWKYIPQGLKPDVYFVAFAAPFDSAQGRLLKSCPFKARKSKCRSPWTSLRAGFRLRCKALRSG